MPKNSRRKRVSFTTTKKVPKKVEVKFTTRDGDKVSFNATKKVPKKVNVEYLAKRKQQL